jgi:hypothetical protein
MAASMKLRIFWDVLPCSSLDVVALMMEAARTSVTSVDIQLRTRQYIPEDSELNRQTVCTLGILIKEYSVGIQQCVGTVKFGCRDNVR